MNDKFINILTDYELEGKPLPQKYTGLTVEDSSIQFDFRKQELEEVMQYLLILK